LEFIIAPTAAGSFNSVEQAPDLDAILKLLENRPAPDFYYTEVTVEVTIGKIALYNPPEGLWLQNGTIQWNERLQFQHNAKVINEALRRGLRYTWPRSGR
jgi:hypothetical protein